MKTPGLKYPHIMQEVKSAVAVSSDPEMIGLIVIRPKRRPNNLPDTKDRQTISSLKDHCWKRARITQYREAQ